MNDALNVPEWNRRKANALMLAQAARIEALVLLLERQGIITHTDLAVATADILRDEKARLIATMHMLDDVAHHSSEVRPGSR